MRPKLKNVNQPEHPHFYQELDKKVQNIICHYPEKEVSMKKYNWYHNNFEH